MGGGRDSDRAWLSKQLFFFFVVFVFFVFFVLPLLVALVGWVVLTSSNLGRAKFESRGMEGTDVIRRTRSTFW